MCPIKHAMHVESGAATEQASVEMREGMPNPLAAAPLKSRLRKTVRSTAGGPTGLEPAIPAPGQQLLDPIDWVLVDAFEHVAEVPLRFPVLGHDRST
jgi:hypothetical protein